jgi:hypothetical protein
MQHEPEREMDTITKTKTQSQETESKYSKFHELPLPDTIPKDGSCATSELMRVVEIMEGPEGTPIGYHVELEDVLDYAENWGNQLAEIARTIARDYDLLTVREDGDLLAAIAAGFNDCLRFYSNLAGGKTGQVKS